MAVSHSWRVGCDAFAHATGDTVVTIRRDVLKILPTWQRGRGSAGILVTLTFLLSALVAVAQNSSRKSVDLIEWNGGRYLYGTYYYPDHWPESMWDRDAQLMQEAGLNVIKTGEGAWGTMEPKEGQYI